MQINVSVASKIMLEKNCDSKSNSKKRKYSTNFCRFALHKLRLRISTLLSHDIKAEITVLNAFQYLKANVYLEIHQRYRISILQFHYSLVKSFLAQNIFACIPALLYLVADPRTKENKSKVLNANTIASYFHGVILNALVLF